MSVLFSALSRHANLTPGKTALAGQSGNIPYSALARLVGEKARILEQRGKAAFGPHYTVGLRMPNSIEWILWDLAALKTGILLVPLPPFFHEDQIRHVVRAAGIKEIIAPEGFINTGELGYIPVPDGTVKITFTSGTTGTPKGVCLSLKGMEDVAVSLIDVIGAEYAERHLSVMPLPILLENVAGVYASLMAGATVYLPDPVATGMANPFQPDFLKLAQAIAERQITSIILIPELLRGLMAVARMQPALLSSLRFIAVGGAKVAPELIEAARALGLPVYEGYGLSECASVVALNTPGEDNPGTVGKILPHIEAFVESGEIIIKNPAFLGYLGQDRQAPFHTGDLGEIDADGTMRISGRKKNIIITSQGRNISPEWIESLCLAQPEIAQAFVYGDALPGPAALIVPAGKDVDIAAAIGRVNARLPVYARIMHCQPVQPFTPQNGMLTASGRPQRENIAVTYRSIMKKEEAVNFYETLARETAPQRQALYTAPQLISGLKGNISRGTYIAYLTQAYHHVKHTVPFLMAMGARLPESKSWLRGAIAEYIEEEIGHEEWILNDITAAGGDREAARASRPHRETELLIAYNYDYIARKNPVGFLGMVFMLESTSTEIATAGADALKKGLNLPQNAFTYLYSHGSIDLDHLEFFKKTVGMIDDPADRDAIIDVAQNTFFLFADVIRSIPMTDENRDAA